MHDSERDRIFGEWLAGHKGILFKVVHAYAFEHADRQDLFQEIVIQVWRSVDAFRGESSVPTWMYRVALNTAIAWTRKEDRHQRGKQPLAVVEGLLTTSSSDGARPRLSPELQSDESTDSNVRLPPHTHVESESHPIGDKGPHTASCSERPFA